MAKPADAAKRQAWERRLRRFESSDWSVAEFCRREGVTEAVFYYWRRRLASSEANSSPRSPRTAAAGAFLPVEVMFEQKLEIELPGGAVVRCPLSSSGNWREVLEAVSQLTQKELRGC